MSTISHNDTSFYKVVETLKKLGYAPQTSDVLANEIVNNLKEYSAKEDKRYAEMLEFRLQRFRARK